jgi:hypothetical protein
MLNKPRQRQRYGDKVVKQKWLFLVVEFQLFGLGSF